MTINWRINIWEYCYSTWSWFIEDYQWYKKKERTNQILLFVFVMLFKEGQLIFFFSFVYIYSWRWTEENVQKYLRGRKERKINLSLVIQTRTLISNIVTTLFSFLTINRILLFLLDIHSQFTHPMVLYREIIKEVRFNIFFLRSRKRICGISLHECLWDNPL